MELKLEWIGDSKQKTSETDTTDCRGVPSVCEQQQEGGCGVRGKDRRRGQSEQQVHRAPSCWPCGPSLGLQLIRSVRWEATGEF